MLYLLLSFAVAGVVMSINENNLKIARQRDKQEHKERIATKLKERYNV